MSAFVVIGTYGPYDDSRFQTPTEGVRTTVFDNWDAFEIGYEWCMSDPTCHYRIVPVPLCNDDETC